MKFKIKAKNLMECQQFFKSKIKISQEVFQALLLIMSSMLMILALLL